MAMTFAMVYLGGWLATTLATYVVSRRLADAPTSAVTTLCLSVLAGLVWPLVVVGLVEYGSVALYSITKAWRHDPDVPDAWLGVGAFDNVVAPLR